MLSSKTKTHGILTHKNLTNVVTQILQILYRAVTLYPIYSLLKESQQTIYRFFLQKTKHGSNGICKYNRMPNSILRSLIAIVDISIEFHTHLFEICHYSLRQLLV